MIHLEDNFIPPKEFGMSGVSVSLDPDNPKKVIIRFSQELEPNHNYLVVVNENLRSESGKRFSESQVLRFSTEYSPLYASPLEVHSILRGLYSQFTLSEIYVALRNAGQKAHQLQGLEVDPSIPGFEFLAEDDSTYFPTTKFVVYEAARALLTSLLMKVLSDNGLGTDSSSNDLTADSVTLGDFSISGSGGGGNATDDSTNPTYLIKAINSTLDGIKDELKFWQDAMMGRNRRGYASPVSVSFRTDAGSPESRDIDDQA